MTFEPNKITREHILRAAEIIDEKEYKISPSTGYDVIIRGKKYPPKEIMRFAHELATGKHLLPVNGGESTNKYLRVLGFEIEIKRNYYVLGAVWDSDEKKPDQSERFIENGIWENAWKDKFLDVVNAVNIGDRVAIKSSFAKKDKSILRIKSTGTVYGNLQDGKTLKINWDDRFEPFDLEGYGGYRKTIHKIKNDDIDVIFNRTGEERFKKADEIISNLAVNNKSEDLEIERTLREINIINRNRSLVFGLKKLYGDQCQLCKKALSISDTDSYSEVHHIKPLGKPHNGPDTSSNMMVVCPNCHVQLDFGRIKLSKKQLLLMLPHDIDEGYIDYHNNK